VNVSQLWNNSVSNAITPLATTNDPILGSLSSASEMMEVALLALRILCFEEVAVLNLSFKCRQCLQHSEDFQIIFPHD
jgi:hypothetical protein